jgi:hypothetical protein
MTCRTETWADWHQSRTWSIECSDRVLSRVAYWPPSVCTNSCTCRVGKVQGALVPGQLPGGQGAAYVEGLVAAEVGEGLGAGGDRGVEVEGVGEVQLAFDADGVVVGDLVGRHVEVPSLGREESTGFCFGGVEPDPGLLDHSLELGVRQLGRTRGDVLVHEPGTRHRQGEGGFRDLAGPPDWQPPIGHEGPDLGAAVADLERVTEVAPAGVGGHADGEGELGDAELRDQRRTLARDRELALPRGRSEAVDRVHRRPLDRELELLGLGPIRDRSPFAGGSQHRGRGVHGVDGCGGCHRTTQALATDSQSPRTPISTGS